MAVLYRIKDWNELYENNRTRELKTMTWVPVPNKMDGDGYTELVSHEDGAAHFGAWIAMLEIASKCEPRGTLVRENGVPHTPASLARISRLPVGVFEELLPRLAGEEIAWVETQQIEVVTEIPQGDATISQGGDYARAGALPFPSLPVSSVPNGKKLKDTSTDSLEQLIDSTARRMLDRHARRKCSLKLAKDKLRTIARKIPVGSRASLLEQIDVNHSAWCESEEWTKDGGQYQKALDAWLNPQARRWEVPPPKFERQPKQEKPLW